jgi:hypothetical protein
MMAISSGPTICNMFFLDIIRCQFHTSRGTAVRVSYLVYTRSTTLLQDRMKKDMDKP